MVNRCKSRLTLLQQEILRFLFMRAGRTFNARGLALSVGVSQPAISKALPFLEKQGYLRVTKDKESKRLTIELERENPLVMGMKRAENLKQVYCSGLVEFLHDAFPGVLIILFGSYSSGEDTERSDIDIAVIGAKEKKTGLERFEKALERKIVLQFYPSLREIHRNLRNNILSGIILEGAVDL